MTPTTEPRKKFRILRDPSFKRVALYYDTLETRAEGARHWANLTGKSVLTELWDPSHPQDYLNLGWAMDGHVAPGAS